MRTAPVVRLAVPGLALTVLLVKVGAGVPAGAAPRVTGGTTPAGAQILVRTGDLAPGPARFTAFADRVAVQPDGGVLFADAIRSTLFLKRGDALEVVAFAGQAAPGGSRFEAFVDFAAGSYGTIAFQAVLADGRTGAYRIPPGAADPELVLVTGTEIEMRSGPATIVEIAGLGVDGGGGVVVEAVAASGAMALIAIAPGASPTVILEPGDPIGDARLTRLLYSPIGVNGGGTVAFRALDDRNRHVLGALTPGRAAVARFLLTPAPGGPTLAVLSRPVINDYGDVAFLWATSGGTELRVQRVAAGGLSTTIGASGLAIEDGGTLSAIVFADPAIAGDGTGYFAGVRNDGRPGIYGRALGDGDRPPIYDGRLPPGMQQAFAVVERGDSVGRAGTFTGDVLLQQALTATDVSLWFPANTSSGTAILAWQPGLRRTEAATGDPIAAPRFVSFTSPFAEFMAAGPAAAPGGLAIFDAQVTGGGRGLYGRRRDASILPVAREGDLDAERGVFAAAPFSFHSINASGAYAFLGLALDAGPPAVSLYAGRLGQGPPRRIVHADAPAAGTLSTAAGAPSYASLPPPSRINATGQVAVILRAASGESLVCFDGEALVEVVRTGHLAPDGGVFTRLFTGSDFLGVEVPPALDDGGRITFGGRTDRGGNALYRARCVAGGGGVPSRVIGAGDVVEGGRLSPFEIRALDTDGAGRVLLQAIYSDDYRFGTFLAGGGPVSALALPFDLLPDGEFVLGVTTRLAFAGARGAAFGVTRFFSGGEAILTQDPAATDEPVVLAATGGPVPEAGTYLALGGSRRTLGGFDTGRLGSDGRGTIVFAAATSEWPEVIVADGLPANAAPQADAGADLTAECAGPDGARVTLDGSGSVDDDGDPLGFTWSGPFGTAHGDRPTVTLAPGVWDIALVVEDGQEASGPDTVRVEVRDTLAPSIAVLPDPALLWPPDRRLAQIRIVIAAADVCDPSPAIVLVDAKSSEPDGSTQIEDHLPGTDDRDLRLQAARSGAGPGRTYTVTYRAADRSGNTSIATATIVVPHDRRPLARAGDAF